MDALTCFEDKGHTGLYYFQLDSFGSSRVRDPRTMSDIARSPSAKNLSVMPVHMIHPEVSMLGGRGGVGGTARCCRQLSWLGVGDRLGAVGGTADGSPL
jgi:hypothetical protein